MLFSDVVIVGRHRTTAFFLARSALPESRLLLPSWRPCANNSVGNAQEIQDEVPQIRQLPAHLFGYTGQRDAAQHRVLDARLLHLQL